MYNNSSCLASFQQIPLLKRSLRIVSKGFNGWNILWELEICLIARRTKLLAQVGNTYDEHSFTSFLCSKRIKLIVNFRICSFRFTSLCKLFIIKSCDLISCFWWQKYLFWPQWKMMFIFMFNDAYYNHQSFAKV